VVFQPRCPILDDLSDAGLKPGGVLYELNVLGVLRVTRALLPRLIASGDGLVVNVGSIAGFETYPGGAGYTASKHAITGLTKSLSLAGREYDIACCQIDIGNAATDLIKAILQDGAGATQADGSKAAEPTLDLDHVAKAIIHMASLPLEANIQFMTIMATKMPFIGRG